METTQRITKKFVNGIDECVDENIDGYLQLHTGLRLLKGHRVIVREDIEEYKLSGKVCLITGGGSGHEPAFAGASSLVKLIALFYLIC